MPKPARTTGSRYRVAPLALATLIAGVAAAGTVREADCPQPAPLPEPAAWTLDLSAGVVPEAVRAFGRKATLELADDGGPVLRMRYHAARSQLAGLTVRDLHLSPQVQTLTLTVKPSSDTSLAVNLLETTGAVYQAFAWLPAGRWSTLRLPLTEFWLAERCADPDGRLQPADVRELRLLDLANLPGQVGRALGLKDGPQWLMLRALSFSAAPAKSRSRLLDGRALVDRFDAQPLMALPIGAPDLSLETLDGRPALHIRYRLGGYRWVGIVRGVGHLPVAQMKAVCFAARASPAVRLYVVVEERDGSKYAAAVPLRGRAGWQPVEVPLAALKPTGDSRDENAVLDPAQVRVVIIVADSFSAPLQPGQRGSVWLSELALRLD